MNQTRRKKLINIQEKLIELQEDLQVIFDEEEEYRDNIPENLQGSERYMIADEACDNIASAIDGLEEAISDIEDAYK